MLLRARSPSPAPLRARPRRSSARESIVQGDRAAREAQPVRFGIAAARLGEVDGVWFETLKWQSVLEQMGHEVVRCAGSLGRVNGPDDALIDQVPLAYSPGV